MLTNPTTTLKHLVKHGIVSIDKFVETLRVRGWVSEMDDLGANSPTYLTKPCFDAMRLPNDLQELHTFFYPGEAYEWQLQVLGVPITEPGDITMVVYDTQRFSINDITKNVVATALRDRAE